MITYIIILKMIMIIADVQIGFCFQISGVDILHNRRFTYIFRTMTSLKLLCLLDFSESWCIMSRVAPSPAKQMAECFLSFFLFCTWQ